MSRKPSHRNPLLYIVPVILCVTAGVQRYLAENHDLNPWKGGGFGMFADLPPYRALTITPVDVQDVAYRTPTPARLQRRAMELGILPTAARLSAFAREFAQAEWILVGLDLGENKQYPVLKEEEDRHEKSRPIEIKGVIVEVSQYLFDPKTNQMKLAPLIKGTSQ